ncbi:unnamed protein product [Ilex paraguariensis]|uniref:Syntaxin N-terminal domain-containing protein n=1 Tax=Ilex paraguariensis TaxID=185542 RepID=A0ABC8QTY5_9AQUA
MNFFQALSRSVSQRDQSQYHTIQMTNSPSNGKADFDKFFEDMEDIKADLRNLETLYNQLQFAQEQSKTLRNPESIKELRSKMDNQVVSSFKKVMFLQTRLQALHSSTASFNKFIIYTIILLIVFILATALFMAGPWW